MTIPAPPPMGVSSTVRCRSTAQARRSCTLRSSRPASRALPTRDRSSGTRYSGKIVTTPMPARTDVRIDVVTIFPEYLVPLDLSLVGKAREAGLLDLRVHDLRAWAVDRHRTVDDTPMGGGAGMVMRPDVWGEALDQVLASATDSAGPGAVELLVPTPSGQPFCGALGQR